MIYEKYRTGHTNGKDRLIQIKVSKQKKRNHTSTHLSNSELKLISCHGSQKHLGLTLDSKLSFNEHIKDKIQQANKGVGLPRKLQAHNSLLTIYKSFRRPLLYYADVIYDQPSNASFSKKLNQFNIMQY